METLVEFPATKKALRAHLKKIYGLKPTDKVSVVFYGWDPRIKWDTFIVSINTEAVGYTSGPLPQS